MAPSTHASACSTCAPDLTRRVDWTSPGGSRVPVTSVRIVSLTQRAIAAITYTVEPADGRLRLVIQSECMANERLRDAGRDPRAAAALEAPLVSEEYQADNDGQCRRSAQHASQRPAYGGGHDARRARPGADGHTQ